MELDTQKLQKEAEALGVNKGMLSSILSSLISAFTGRKIAEVKSKANQYGLGGVVDTAVNAAEQKAHIDLDGDKDVGK